MVVSLDMHCLNRIEVVLQLRLTSNAFINNSSTREPGNKLQHADKSNKVTGGLYGRIMDNLTHSMDPQRACGSACMNTACTICKHYSAFRNDVHA
eukprot:m.349488 g.349488  ORF g.349488 m.349488 type:complete len:95 (+) comp20689_c1_seq1:1425-1709(+)